MALNRRSFIRYSSLAAVAGVAGTHHVFGSTKIRPTKGNGKGLSLSFVPYELQLNHVFTLANRNNFV